MIRKLVVTRNFLYRLFLIGFAINLGAQAVFVAAAKNERVKHLSKFLNISPLYLNILINSAIILTRVVFLYFILFPALALHWTVARDKYLIEKRLWSEASCLEE